MKTSKNILTTLSLLFLFSFCADKQQKKEALPLDIDFNETYQTIEGFGTCLITYKDYPEEYSDPEFLDMVVNDLGLSLMRIPVMEHAELGNDDSDPNHFNWDGFYTQNNYRRKGIASTMKLLQEFKKRGVNRFMATPWSPPAFMKTHRAPIQGGHLRADMTAEFAEYLAAYIMLAKKNWGIDINWMSIQNELLFAQFYRSCVYQPWILRETVRAVDKKFKQENISTKILMPEDMMFPHRMLMYIQPTMNDPETKDFNGEFSTHRKAEKEGLLEWISNTEQYNRQNWMTETSGHNPDWQGAFKMASDIQTYLVHGNFSAWVYWQLSGGTGGDPEHQGKYTLLTAGKPTPKYYAAKHFYKFIRPGAVRVKAQVAHDSLLVSAFKHPVNGTFTVVLINQSNKDTAVYLNNDSDKIPENFEVYRTSATENCEQLTDFSKDEVLTVPAQSIITLIGKNEKLQTKDKIELPEPWEIPAGAENESWGNNKDLNIEKEWQRMPDGSKSMIEEAKKIVENNAINQSRYNGWTLMHDAILQADGKTISYLLKNGADVNAAANDGWTPLHAAAASFANSDEYTKYDIFQLVLKANPNVNAKTKDGWTPLHAAVANAYTGWRQKVPASINRVKDLVKAGAEINAKDINGRTPLHWACWQGFSHYTNGVHEIKPDVVNVLLQGNADMEITDKTGRTALHYAAEMGYERIVWALIKAGANKAVKDNQQQTPLDLAKARKLENVVYIFENNQLPPEMSDSQQNTDTASGKYGQELVDAAWNGNVEKVKELLNKGADVNYVDSDGFKAIDRARDNGHDKIVKLLENAAK